MKKTARIELYEDPGHGWAKVPVARLKKLGIADKITPYSYVRGAYAFLEEDCDLSTYCNALKAAGVTDFNFVVHSGNRSSKIRNYNRYTLAS